MGTTHCCVWHGCHSATLLVSLQQTGTSDTLHSTLTLAPCRRRAYYVPSLKQIAVLRLLKQLSEVYSTMQISALAELVPFASFSEVEAIIVDAVKYDYLQVGWGEPGFSLGAPAAGGDDRCC